MNKLLAIALTCLLLASCAKSVPTDKLDYVGQWQSPEMSLLILKDGTIAYKRLQHGGSTSINAGIKEFQGDNFVVGILFFTTTFEVSAVTHQVDNQWKMTVDGVELTRTTP